MIAFVLFVIPLLVIFVAVRLPVTLPVRLPTIPPFSVIVPINMDVPTCVNVSLFNIGALKVARPLKVGVSFSAYEFSDVVSKLTLISIFVVYQTF
jgi:hypothetical protein